MMKDKSDQVEPQDALNQIKGAEAEAKKIIQRAREKDSMRIIQEAQEEARKIIEEHLSGIRDKARNTRLTLIQQAEKEAEEIRKNAEKEATALRKKAEILIPEAVRKTANKISALLKKL